MKRAIMFRAMAQRASAARFQKYREVMLLLK
jgi:hypothetical protein